MVENISDLNQKAVAQKKGILTRNVIIGILAQKHNMADEKDLEKLQALETVNDSQPI